MKCKRKVTIYRWLAAMLFVAAFLGGKGFASLTHGQSLSKELYTYKQAPDSSFLAHASERVSLESALAQIQDNYDISFLYDPDILKGKYVHGSFLQADSLGFMLREALIRNGLVYSQESDRQYAIMPMPDFNLNQRSPIQAATVNGSVTDANTGETIPGVNILVKGTTTGTSTGADGNYELTVPSLQDTLVFSFIGYQTQEIPINGRTIIDVSLQMEALMGEELVVVGYGTQRQQEITSAVSRVSAEDFNEGGVQSPIDLVQGKVAGLTLTRTAGSNPNAETSMQLRGVASLAGNIEPLIVIDGIPGGNMDLLQPTDIASIDVLKDGSAAAIYGTRGNNGVILITTKKGQGGAARYEYSTYVRHEAVAKKPDYL